MAADAKHLFMSLEEYLELDRNSFDARYEFIDGMVTRLAGGTTNHSHTSVNVRYSNWTWWRNRSAITHPLSGWFFPEQSRQAPDSGVRLPSSSSGGTCSKLPAT